jgi:hypothetical protein
MRQQLAKLQLVSPILKRNVGEAWRGAPSSLLERKEDHLAPVLMNYYQ